MKAARITLIAVLALSATWFSSNLGLKAQTPAPPKSAGQSPEPKKETDKLDRPLRTFMRAKLIASTKILEGLTLDDLDMVLDGALEMNKMSKAQQWRRHDDMLYRQFSAEFSQTTSDLIDAAKQGMLDRAALKWMDATMNCIDCHRYVRNNLVASDQAPPKAPN